MLRFFNFCHFELISANWFHFKFLLFVASKLGHIFRPVIRLWIPRSGHTKAFEDSSYLRIRLEIARYSTRETYTSCVRWVTHLKYTMANVQKFLLSINRHLRNIHRYIPCFYWCLGEAEMLWKQDLTGECFYSFFEFRRKIARVFLLYF